MCDDEAAKEILSRISSPDRGALDSAHSMMPYGLHFIDNGNFHYMSSIYLSQVKEPFSLIVLDHHPDMQRPMFDILSCGGWIVDVLDHNEFVRDVHVIGADEKLIDELDDEDRKKVHFYNIEDIFSDGPGGEIIVNLPDSSFPVYLSIDKDVIRKEELTTNWDQGEARPEQVLEFVRALPAKRRLLGVDICGECAPDQEGCDLSRAIEENDRFNARVLEILEQEIGING
ncbi:arginase family protein [Butyrivibrio sp. CB08]|uniref:arginase family protein n=1 Tax=Butyrivibrio sp. CB08 TaxID=2364879 RepID=UPI001314C725|nr:arginase family protein [Butyrivibrio sp. CB08]